MCIGTPLVKSIATRYGRQWRTDALQLFEQQASRFVAEWRQALNHAVTFDRVEDAIPSLLIVLQPGTCFPQCRAFAEVDHGFYSNTSGNESEPNSPRGGGRSPPLRVAFAVSGSTTSEAHVEVQFSVLAKSH